ncbi:MAG: DNA alkylation repair protein [Patescibacteria group bacterium]|nr:DNA alkylation repair protein [Patescibacteria group bacterium]
MKSVTSKLKSIKAELRKHADKVRAEHSKSFFKTKRGEYGYGDVFLGLTVPLQREIAKKYYDLPLSDVFNLLKSKIHEERLTALIILVHAYQKGDSKAKSKIFTQYLKHAKWINNWDLVDTSAPQIIGDFCWRNQDRATSTRLIKSSDLWERRIGVLASFMFIKHGDVELSLNLASKLLQDKHDLMHKAVGWMLREAEKRKPDEVRHFLELHATSMPRTMLRYAIERFPERERKKFLLKKKDLRVRSPRRLSTKK